MKIPADIVEALARERRVEDIVLRIAKGDNRKADLEDLAQLVYLSLLTMDPEQLSDLYENGQINFYLVRVVKNQYYQHRSWYRQTRAFQACTTTIDETD